MNYICEKSSPFAENGHFVAENGTK